jgi:hypothetical protein
MDANDAELLNEKIHISKLSALISSYCENARLDHSGDHQTSLTNADQCLGILRFALGSLSGKGAGLEKASTESMFAESAAEVRKTSQRLRRTAKPSTGVETIFIAFR